MRPRAVDVCAGGLLLLFGCDGLFRITVRESALTEVERASIVEGVVSDLGFETLVEMDLSESEELQNEGVEPGDIEEAELVLFGLEVQTPLDGDLAWIDSLDVFVAAPELPEVLLAHQDDFPPGVRAVEMELEPVDLTPYVVSRSMTVRTEMSGQRPDRNHVVTALFAVEVGVTGQGACRQL